MHPCRHGSQCAYKISSSFAPATCADRAIDMLQVKEVAHTVVASNDDGGIAEAIEKFIL